jgi:hypothetical protein
MLKMFKLNREPTVKTDRFVFVNAQVGLVAKLEWRAVGSDSKKAIRQAAAEMSASLNPERYAVLRGQKVSTVGFYSPSYTEEMAVMPKTLVSLAAAFFYSIPVDARIDAAFVWVLDPAQNDNADAVRAAYVRVDNGLISVDTVEELALVLERAKSAANIFTNLVGAVHLPDAQVLNVKQLSNAFERSSLQRIPVNYAKFAAPALVGVGVIAVGAALFARAQHEERVRLEAAEKARDPRLLYDAASRTAFNAVYVPPAQWVKVISAMTSAANLPVAIPGWAAKTATCTASTGKLTTTWARSGGTYDELRGALPNQLVQAISNSAAGGSLPDTEKAQSVTSCAVSLGPYPAIVDGKLKPQAEHYVSNLTFEQRLKTAKFTVAPKPPVVYPTIDGSAEKLVSYPPVVLRGDYSISSVPMVFVPEVLNTLPMNVAISSVTLTLQQPSNDNKQTVLVSLDGHHYVKP